MMWTLAVPIPWIGGSRVRRLWVGVQVGRMWRNFLKLDFLEIGRHSDLAFFFVDATSRRPTSLWKTTLHWASKRQAWASEHQRQPRPGWSLTYQKRGLQMVTALSLMLQPILIPIPLTPQPLLSLLPWAFPWEHMDVVSGRHRAFLKLLLWVFMVLLILAFLGACAATVNVRVQIGRLRHIPALQTGGTVYWELEMSRHTDKGFSLAPTTP